MCMLSLSGFVFAEDIVIKVNLVDEHGIRLQYFFATNIKDKC